MIEELKLLIPLLQSAGEGVFWVALLIIGKDALAILMWPLCIGIIVGAVVYVILRVSRQEEQNAYFWKELYSDIVAKMASSGYKVDSRHGISWQDASRLVSELAALKETKK